jgi:3-oxoacyl-[acyl-carrier protein] reductase
VRVAVTARRLDKLEELAQAITAAGGQQPVLIEQDMYAEDAAEPSLARAASRVWAKSTSS